MCWRSAAVRCGRRGRRSITHSVGGTPRHPRAGERRRGSGSWRLRSRTSRCMVVVIELGVGASAGPTDDVASGLSRSEAFCAPRSSPRIRSSRPRPRTGRSEGSHIHVNRSNERLRGFRRVRSRDGPSTTSKAARPATPDLTSASGMLSGASSGRGRTSTRSDETRPPEQMRAHRRGPATLDWSDDAYRGSTRDALHPKRQGGPAVATRPVSAHRVERDLELPTPQRPAWWTP
jgi:hypothetical protein